jgi:uncharacterized membrane protein YhhN
MNVFELLIFVVLSAGLLALGQFLSKKWGTPGLLVGVVPVALFWLWALSGTLRSTIADIKRSIRPRQPK